MPISRRSSGPGRVNLIGDHTDYNDGVALPMAIDRRVTVAFELRPEPAIDVTSSGFTGPARLPVGPSVDPVAVATTMPAWSRPIAAMIAVVGVQQGGTLRIESDLPVGSGLSSSAALAVALAEVFGVEGSPEEVARLCQQAEQLSGGPGGSDGSAGVRRWS